MLLEFCEEMFCYLFFGGTAQAILAVIVLPLYLLAVGRLAHVAFGRSLRIYLVFNAALLLWGCAGHYVFYALTFGKRYVSIDRWSIGIRSFPLDNGCWTRGFMQAGRPGIS
jgi:hypothetical protein